MPREQLIRSEPHEDYYSENDESGPNYHRVSKRAAADSLSHASLYSIIDLDHETLIERATQLAAMLDKSARDLTQYTKLARVQDGLTITKKKKPKLPKGVTNNLLPITALWQALCLLALTVVDIYCKRIEKTKYHTLSYNISIGITSVFQFANLCLVFAATVKLTKQYIHKTASMRFLINGYLSMIVLFAGLYMLIYRFNKEAFTPPLSKDFQYSIEVFTQMLNVSISTATLCGAANITGKSWYAALAMSFQMLISFIYFASFLSQVLSPPKPAAAHERKSLKFSRSVYGSV